MKKIFNQAPIVRYRASVSEIFFLILGMGVFQQNRYPDLAPFPLTAGLFCRQFCDYLPTILPNGIDRQ